MFHGNAPWMALAAALAVTIGFAAELSAPTYSYLGSVTYSSQKRGPESWGVIKSADMSSTLYPLCATTLQQSPIALYEQPTAAQNGRTANLKPLVEMLDAGWPSGASLTGLDAFKPDSYATVTALYLQRMVTSCSWWTNGAELRLTNFDKTLQFVDPDEVFSGSVPSVAYRTKTLQSVNFVVGSAHTVGGERRDLEIQYVFALDSSVQAAAETAGVPTTTVVSVTARAGLYSSHTLLGKLLSYLTIPSLVPASTPPPSALTSPISDLNGIDLTTFLPASTSYFTYVGSETSPPCRRARWFVFKEPIQVAMHQIAFIREKLGLASSTNISAAPSTFDTIRGNYRPAQVVASSSSTVSFFEEISVDTPLARQRGSRGPDYNKITNTSVASIVLSLIACLISLLAAYVNWSRRTIGSDVPVDAAKVRAHGDSNKSAGKPGSKLVGAGPAVSHQQFVAAANSTNRPGAVVLSDDEDDEEDGGGSTSE